MRALEWAFAGPRSRPDAFRKRTDVFDALSTARPRGPIRCLRILSWGDDLSRRRILRRGRRIDVERLISDEAVSGGERAEDGSMGGEGRQTIV